MEFFGVFAVVGLVNQRTNASFKIGWLVIITLVPIAGFIMYFLWGANRSARINKRNMSYISYGYKFLEALYDALGIDSFVDSCLKRDKFRGEYPLAKILKFLLDKLKFIPSKS